MLYIIALYSIIGAIAALLIKLFGLALISIGLVALVVMLAGMVTLKEGA